MTPDKIYIFEDGDEQWYDVKEWEGRTPPPMNVEYIRKDALVEWAKQKQYESLTIVADNFWQEVIDKINSL